MVIIKHKLLKSLQVEQKLEHKILQRTELEYKEETVPYLKVKLDAQRIKTNEFASKLIGE